MKANRIMLKRKKMNKPMKQHQTKTKTIELMQSLGPQIMRIQAHNHKNNKGLNALSQMEKDDSDPAPAGVQKKPRQREGSKKSKTEGLNTTDEPSQGNNAQAQTKPTSKALKPKVISKKGTKNLNKLHPYQKTLMMRGKRSIAPDLAGTLQPREVSVEISPW
ncbi:MAG: hypothetical protein EZS28_053318, partial [Streblomastix strix]